MMDIFEAIYNRKSVRHFSDKKISRETILKIIDSAQQAPSACNQQLWRFIVVENDSLKKELVHKAGGINLFLSSSAIIFVLYKHNNVTDELANVQSASASIQNMLLAAHALGLGATWINYIGDRRKIHDILQIPKEFFVLAAVIMGYPKGKIKKPTRPLVDEIVSFDKYDFQLSLLNEFSPKKWNLKTLLEMRSKTLRLSEPEEGAFPYGTKGEFDSELSITLRWLSHQKSTLEIMPFAGTHSIQILKKMSAKNFFLLSESVESDYFLMQRFKKVGINGRVLQNEGEILKKKFKQIICFQKLEEMPSLSWIQKVSFALEKDGVFVLSFRNSISFFGVHSWLQRTLFRKMPHTPIPFEPLNVFDIKQILLKNGFIIEEQFGISLFFFLRGKIVNGFFSNFCKLVLVKCKKKVDN